MRYSGVILVLFIIVVGAAVVLARRGGGFRGGSRFRSGSTFRAGSTRRLSSFGSGSSYRVALTAGLLYGVGGYRRRSYYRSHPRQEPTICENLDRFKYSNGSTKFEFFICPEEGMSDDFTFCCGPDKKQHCCNFWAKPGNVVGVVFGILFAIALLAGGIYVFYKCKATNKHKGKVLYNRNTNVTNQSTAPSAYSTFQPPAPQTNNPPTEKPSNPDDRYDQLNRGYAPPAYSGQSAGTAPYPTSGGTAPYPTSGDEPGRVPPPAYYESVH